MKKVGISGHFGLGFDMLNGQTIKTKTVAEELKRRFGNNEVEIVDTHGGTREMPRMFIQLWKMFQNCETIIMFPAYNGLRIFTPVYLFYNLFFHRKIQYVVIGGWLNSFLDKHKCLSHMLKKFDGIFVETKTMKNTLEKNGFRNVSVMPNFKKLCILKPEELNCQIEKPYKICTFSRVMKEKGIEDAIDVVKHINENAGYAIFMLDIYGQIDVNYEKTFAELQSEFPDYIVYRGKVPFDKTVEIIKKYFVLLFPTHFYTEGIPGTIIDAYAAGVPVISAIWESFADVIDNNVTGIGYSFSAKEELERILLYVASHPDVILEMKKKCLNKAEEFTPEIAITNLYRQCC